MKKISAIFFLTTILVASCSIFQTIENVGRLKYRIHSALDYKLGGISINNKTSIRDFSAIDLLKLSANITKGNLPLTFQINVEAKNPNDGTGGGPRTDINLNSFPWRMFLNDKELVSGNIAQPVFVPGKGESVLIPIQVEIDLVKAYENKSLNELVNLVLQLGGMHGSTSNLKLLVKPVLGTPIGNIKYPNEITIVDKTFN